MAVKGHSLKLNNTSEPVALLKYGPVIIRYIEEKTPFLIKIFMIRNSFHLYSHTQYIIKQKHRYPKSSKKKDSRFEIHFFLSWFKNGFPCNSVWVAQTTKTKGFSFDVGSPWLGSSNCWTALIFNVPLHKESSPNDPVWINEEKLL